MGLPFDAVDNKQATELLLHSINSRKKCFLTTPNLDFAIEGLQDHFFRRSVLNSDLVVADGMPIIWVAKFLGIPLPERVAGSTLFDSLRFSSCTKPIRIFFFGGPEGIAEKACEVLQSEKSALAPAGFHYPGFGSVEDMSRDDIIKKINDSNADFIVVALGAKKGQAWIELNQDKLSAPALSHLGAVVNFVAGSVKRAPMWMQSSGLEWIWRLLEESRLFNRYWHDGISYLRILYRNVLPYRRYLKRQKLRLNFHNPFGFVVSHKQDCMTVLLSGDACIDYILSLREMCASSLKSGLNVTLDCSGLENIDCAALGLFQLLEAELRKSGMSLSFKSVPPTIERIMCWNLVDYLLDG